MRVDQRAKLGVEELNNCTGQRGMLKSGEHGKVKKSAKDTARDHL